MEDDKKLISLQISGKIECDYGYNQLFTQTLANEQFSVTPIEKPSLSVTSSRNLVEIGTEKTEARGTSPLDSIVHVDASVSCSNAENDRNDRIQTKTIKINTTDVKTVPYSQKSFKLVTRNILNVKPVSLKGDVRVAQIQQQAEQISELKKHILRLQFTPSDSMGSVLSSVSSTISLINDNIKTMQSTSGSGILISKSASVDGGLMVNKPVSSTSTAQNLREAIEDSSNIVEIVVKDQNHLLSSNNDIFMRINEATTTFLKEMAKDGGASTECQSRFLRQINEIGADFADSLSLLQANLKNEENVKSALVKANEELEKTEKFVESLQKTILDLKLGTGKSHIAQQLADIKDELSNIIDGKGESNHLIRTKKKPRKSSRKLQQEPKTTT